MNHTKIALCTALISTSLTLQGCEMDSGQKLAFGAAAIGTVSAVTSKLFEDNKAEQQKQQQEEQRALEQAEIATLKAHEAQMTGNFGLTLGQKLNTNLCQKEQRTKHSCVVPHKGSKFFEKAEVIYNPETKEIAEIIGYKKSVRFDIPASMQGSKSDIMEKREFIDAQAKLYVSDQLSLIEDVLRKKGWLREDDTVDWQNDVLWDGPTKSLFLEHLIVDTNLGDYFTNKPYQVIVTSFHYRDKEAYTAVENVLQNQHDVVKDKAISNLAEEEF